MSGPATPARVIYAKRTSVGAWDVVAKTANITESDALTLAERLLLGSPPHDAEIVEEVAYVHHPDGGHIVLRFSPYAWRDPQGRRVFMSDILWLSDADFDRARGNAFAILPHCDDVFENLAELPPVTLPSGSAADEAVRLGTLPRDTETESMIAGAIAFGPVMIVDEGRRVAKAELFTLLLPPAARTLFTFQTRSFRVPEIMPRVTMSDAYYSNLHSGPWQAVLPDIARDLPVSLARTLLGLGGQPDVLHSAHDLRNRIGGPAGDLRSEVTRVIELAKIVTLLAADPSAALQQAARRATPDASALLRELVSRTTDDAVRTATLALAANPRDHGFAQRIIAEAAVAKRSSGLDVAVAEQLVRDRVVPDAALGTQLVSRLALDGDVNSLLSFLAVDLRETASFVRDPESGVTPALAEFLLAFRERSQAKRRLSAAPRLLDAMTGLGAGAYTHPSFAPLARDAVRAAIDEVDLDSRSVGHVRSLQQSLDRFVAAAGASSMPALATDAQLPATDAAQIRAGRSQEAVAVIACTLLMRATGPQAESRAALANTLLNDLPQHVRETAGRILNEQGIGEAQLVSMPGAKQVLAQFGRSAERVGVVQAIVAAVQRLETSEDDAVAALAVATLHARNANIQLSVADSNAIQPIGKALGSAIAKHRSTQDWSALELMLDMLAFASDLDAFRALHDAAVGDGSMTIRLRRLARAGAECRAAGDRYPALVKGIEDPHSPLDGKTLARLREDLNTRGLQSRLIDMISGVMDPHARQ